MPGLLTCKNKSSPALSLHRGLCATQDYCDGFQEIQKSEFSPSQTVLQPRHSAVQILVVDRSSLALWDYFHANVFVNYGRVGKIMEWKLCYG